MIIRPALALSLLLVAACSNPVRSATTPALAAPDAEPPPAEPASKSPLAEKADALFSQALADGVFSGSIAVVDGGNTVLAKAYGEANREEGKPNAVDTIFRAGSLSKQFTAAAMVALAEDGTLAVTDPLSKYVPEIPPEHLQKDGIEVTLHHLLSHTSGLPNPETTTYFQSNAWLQPMTPVSIIDAAKDQPLIRKPGTTYEYLNYNYLLLGLVLERASGKSYDTFLRERFFTPLRMSDTGALLAADVQARAAKGYVKTKAGKFLSFADDAQFQDRDLTLAFGFGQTYSTVQDLVRWDRALADGTIKGQAQLFKPNLSDYGYGWIIEKSKGVEYIWHGGALSPLGFSSFLVRVPSKGRMIAYLSNLDIALTEELRQKVTDLALE